MTVPSVSHESYGHLLQSEKCLAQACTGGEGALTLGKPKDFFMSICHVPSILEDKKKTQSLPPGISQWSVIFRGINKTVG